MDIFELNEERRKAQDPYGYWISQNEKWRGQTVSREIMSSFKNRYKFRFGGRYVNDPDLYERFALYASGGEYDVIYCDEDVVSDGCRRHPFFKPDFSPDTLESFDYLGKLLCVSNEYIRQCQTGSSCGYSHPVP